MDSLRSENERLSANIESLGRANKWLKAVNDSLKQLPPKIKEHYTTIYKTIDRLDKRDTEDTLRRLFARNGVDSAHKDTFIYISPAQSKFLIKVYYHNGELTELLQTEQARSANLECMLENDSLAFTDYKRMIVNQAEQVSLKDIQITGLQDKVKEKDRQLKRQKVFKWIGAAAGLFCIGYLNFLRISKI
jgi:hypothetical protein